MWITEPLEIRKGDEHTGKWRLTARSDEDGPRDPIGLCDHEHDSPEEARKCPDALKRQGPVTGVGHYDTEEIERMQYRRLHKKYGGPEAEQWEAKRSQTHDH